MLTDRQHTACFTGHRQLPEEHIETVIKNLNETIDRLIGQNIVNFISGGALGFDLIAAAMILTKKESHPHIRLVFALPCADQSRHWTIKEQTLYQNLLQEADEVICLSQNYYQGCMKARNRYMVDQSAVCVCALGRAFSGTGQTVRYARKEGVAVINLLK